jgi:molybdopterin synthase catalytic subunit
MSITVDILDGPLPGADPTAGPPGAGATLLFEGIVRPTEDARPLAALDYEAYEPMATDQLIRLAREISDRHGLLAVHVQHSRGRVRVGEVSFRLRIDSPHRAEGLAAMDGFIDTMKRDVPIWKSPVWAGAEQQSSR